MAVNVMKLFIKLSELIKRAAVTKRPAVNFPMLSTNCASLVPAVIRVAATTTPAQTHQGNSQGTTQHM